MKKQKYGITVRKNSFNFLKKRWVPETWNYRIFDMDKLLAFKVFCLENYKAVHNISGKAAYDIFQKYRVFDYITSYYDVLHSYGRLYIVSDIDDYIARRS